MTGNFILGHLVRSVCRRRCLRSGIALLLFALAGLADAQAPKYGVHEKAIERVSEARDIAPLKVDGMFGDSLSMYNGSVDFGIVDVSIPGNSGLPVELRRRFNVVDRRETASVTWFDHFGGFAEWDLDIPHLSGTFAAATGWQVSGSSPNQRCSTTNAPPAQTYFPAYHYWNGYRLNTPGQGERPLLVRAAGSPIPSPSDGAAYPWITKDFWTIKCKSSTKNGYAGEAFIAVSPEGTRYHLDHVISKSTSSSRNYAGNTEVSIARVSVYFVATRVEDRFGNWVDYAWSGDKLQSITSSDGRQIVIAYDASGRIASATAPSGTWNYTYLNGRLRTVTRPDASQWTYQAEGKLNLAGADPLPMDDVINNCPENFDGVGGGFNYTVTHPSGATARFEFQGMRHHRSNTPKHCVKPNNQYEYLQIPNYSDNFTLTKKTITGPSLEAMVWNYSYGPGASDTYQTDCDFGIEELCPPTKQQVVTGPGGVWERYEYGIMYGIDEGQLLKKEVGGGPANILQTEIYTFVPGSAASSQNFPDMVGVDPRAFSDTLSSAKLRPMVARTVQRQGIDFNWGVNTCSGKYCFDVFANVTGATKASTSPGGPAKVVLVDYEHNYAYWVLSQVKKTTEGGIVASETSYDLMAMPQVMKSFGKVKQTLGYYTDGTVATVKDGNNNTIALSNWYRGIPRSIAYPDSTTQSATVSGAGWVTSVTDQNGYVTGYGYDTMGRLASVVYPTGDSTAWATTTQVFQPIAVAEYGIPAGHWRQTVSTGNGYRITYFDALWRPVLTKELDATNGTTETLTKRFQRFTYDHEGRVTFASYPGTTDALSTGTWTIYDVLGRTKSVSQDSEHGLLTTTTSYINNSGGGPYTLVTTPAGQQTRTWFQMFDQPDYSRPTRITHPEGVVTTIERDVFGKPTSIKRGNSSGSTAITRSYTYNSYQELCRSQEPETGTTLMGYDNAGNLAWSAAGLPAGTACHATGLVSPIQARRVARTYDARNRIATLAFPDGLGNTTHTYTPDGLLASIAAEDGTNTVTTQYTYNRRRLPTQERMLWGSLDWSIGYGYDGNGSLASQTTPGGLTVNYAPNALGQPTQAGSYATGVQYYPNGAIKQFTYGNGIVHTLTQNARQLPARSTDCAIAGACASANRRLDLSYAYDVAGNVSGITDNRDGRQTRSMAYDGLDRLTQTISPMFGTASYGYNVLDNLTTVKVTGGSNARDHTYVYDTENRLGNIKQTVGGATVVGLGYDVQGNLANRNGQAYSFDYGNRLRGVMGKASYVYDGHGRRVRDYTTASKYSLYSQGGQLVHASDNRQAKVTQYIYLGGSLVAFRETPTGGGTSTVKYQHTDALGTPIAVTDAGKAIIETSEYEPYGQLVNGTLKDGPGFTGHVQDAATGLTYMQQRYFDPQSGVFLSVDPVTAYSNPVGQFHRYRYANNSPYKFTDPDGRLACLPGRELNNCASNLKNPWSGRPVGGGCHFCFGGGEQKQDSKNEPEIPLATSMAELMDNVAEWTIRRTSFSASGGAAAGLGVDAIATKTTRPWQKDKVGVYQVFGLGAYAGANANFRLFSWGEKSGTTGLRLKANPLGYFKFKVGAGLSLGLSGQFNDHGEGRLNVTFGGGIGAQAIVKPPLSPGWEKEF